MEKVKAGLYISSNAVIKVQRKHTEPNATGQEGKARPYALWGENNDYPQRICDLVDEESNTAAALNFKIKAHFGKGLAVYRKRFENGREYLEPIDLSLPAFAEIYDFMEASSLDNYLEGIITDFEYFWNCFTLLYRSKSGTKIARMDRAMAIETRAEKRKKSGLNRGRILHYYMHEDWPKAPTMDKVTRLSAYNPEEPLLNPVSIYQHQQPSANRIYYSKAAWHSGYRWMDLAIEISTWILSNIKNSVNIKFMVVIMQEYFDLVCPRDLFNTDEEWIAACDEEERRVLEDIDTYMKGSKNTGKFFHQRGRLGEKGPEKYILIEEFQAGTNHEAYLPAYDTATAAISTSQNVPPSISGIIMSSKMGSGSDVREQFNHYLQLHTVIPRQTTLEALYKVKHINGWPRDIHFGYRDVILQTLDHSKAGAETQFEAKPTSENK